VLDARQTPGSCRNAASVHLLTSNGTPLKVKAAITHHPGSLSQGATWAVSLTRSSESAAADERRLLLRVKMDGTIVGVSRSTPAALFGCDPGHLVGGRLAALVDVFLEYSKGGEFPFVEWVGGFVREGQTRCYLAQRHLSRPCIHPTRPPKKPKPHQVAHWTQP